jgi:outer membrane lipoprotein-sorting protein
MVRLSLYGAIWAVCLILIAGNIFAAGDLSRDEFLQAVDAIRAPGENFSFDLKITSKKPDEEPVVQKLTVYVKDATKSLVKFLYPPENKGQLILMVGQNLWVYMPAINQPLRISPQQRLLGQVSYGDVARVVYSYEYTVESEKKERSEGKDLRLLMLTAKTKDATYGKIDLWIEADTHRPYKAHYYAFSGKLLKTAYYKNYRTVLGNDRPMMIEIHDAVHKGEASLMEYSNLEIVNMPASYFQKEYLKHVR